MTKFYPSSRGSLKVLLSHWRKHDLIHGLGRGLYTFDLVELNYPRLAHEIDPQSYISFEYALYSYNLIDQVPAAITMATRGRSKTVTLGNWTFEFTRMKEEFFGGYELKDGMYIATAEKALVDLIYLIARGKRITELDTLEKEKLNTRKLRDILKGFPSYVAAKAAELNLMPEKVG